jgi:uncharacterized protein YjiS (DUF1127 family)
MKDQGPFMKSKGHPMTCVTSADIPSIGARPSSFWQRIRLAVEARRQRRALLDLTPERLDDLGLSRATAHDEATKPIWNVPAHWLR